MFILVRNWFLFTKSRKEYRNFAKCLKEFHRILYKIPLFFSNNCLLKKCFIKQGYQVSHWAKAQCSKNVRAVFTADWPLRTLQYNLYPSAISESFRTTTCLLVCQTATFNSEYQYYVLLTRQANLPSFMSFSLINHPYWWTFIHSGKYLITQC